VRTQETHLVHEFVLDQLDGVGVHAALPEVQELVHLINKKLVLSIMFTSRH
jgi:hypothetical protein